MKVKSPEKGLKMFGGFYGYMGSGGSVVRLRSPLLRSLLSCFQHGPDLL